MRSQAAEASSRMKDLQSSSGLSSVVGSLPSIISMMRSEFLPLIQCLEQGNDVLCKTYIVELVLTLSRIDTVLKEEERRAFVCAFDALVGRLVKDLHHFMDVERLLLQDLLMLTELEERCRRVGHAYNKCPRNCTTCGGGSSDGVCSSKSKDIQSTTVCPSETGGIAVDGKVQEGTPDICETCAVVNDASVELQQVLQSEIGNLPQSDSSAMISGAFSANNAEAGSGYYTSASQAPIQQATQPPASIGAIPSRNFSAKQSYWWREVSSEFLGGKVSKSDITALMNILSPHCIKNINTHQSNNSNKESMFHASVNPPARTSGNNKDNTESSVMTRAPSHRDMTAAKQVVQSVEEGDGLFQDGDGLKTNETTRSSSQRTVTAEDPFMIQTALFLNMLMEGLLFSGYPFVSSQNNSFGSMEEAEQNSAASDTASGRKYNNALLQQDGGDMLGRGITLPSPAALNLLCMVFPSLRNYADGVVETVDGAGANNNNLMASSDHPTRRAQGGFQRMKGNHGTASTGGTLLDKFPDSGGHHLNMLHTTTSTNRLVRPTDVVLYLLLRYLQGTRSDSSATNTNTSTGTGAGGSSNDVINTLRCEEPDQSKPPNSSMESASVKTQPQLPDKATTTPTLPRRLGIELELMIKQVQECVSNARAMQEQIREEVTLLIFRVMSTTINLLLPGVQIGDLRTSFFYRKWVCDMYRLLWEEDLLERFSTLLANSSSLSSSNENTAVANPSLAQTQPTTPRRSGTSAKSYSEKMGSAGTSSTAVTVEKTNKISPAKQPPTEKSKESVEEKREEDVLSMIAPGNVYSRVSRSHTDSGSEMVSLNPSIVAQSSKILGIPVAAVATAVDFSHHGLGIFDDPMVLVAESLLEDSTTKIPSSRRFIMTRLMAALLRDWNTEKILNLALSERSSSRSNPTTTTTTNTTTTTTTLSRNAKQPARKKNVGSIYHFPLTTKTAQMSPGVKSGVSQPTSRPRYPVVANANDVKSLYFSLIFDSEVALSPLDPVRAALVQNTVDFLVSGMNLPREAYELLDAYLDDVGTEPIQRPAVRRVALDTYADSLRGSGDNPLAAADSRFSVTTVRRARQMPSDGQSGIGGKSHASHSSQAKRGGAVEKDAHNATLRLPLIPKVIPSWNTQEETELFLVILALLRREYIALRSKLGIKTMVPDKEGKDIMIN